MLLVVYQDCIVWMYNVVYMLSFLQIFDENLVFGYCEKLWFVFYYVMILVGLSISCLQFFGIFNNF